MSEASTAVVRNIEEAWNSGRIGELDQYFSETFNNQQSRVPMLPVGLEGAKAAHQMAMSSFPDRKVEILDIVADDDRVVVRSRVTGTNNNGVPWIGAEANNAPIDIESWSIYRLEGGKVVEHWGINDAFALALQTGVLKMPVPA
jgi:predicted ester cyclase